MTLVFTPWREVGRGQGEPPDPLRTEECVPGHKQNKLQATGLTPAKNLATGLQLDIRIIEKGPVGLGRPWLEEHQYKWFAGGEIEIEYYCLFVLPSPHSPRFPTPPLATGTGLTMSQTHL